MNVCSKYTIVRGKDGLGMDRWTVLIRESGSKSGNTQQAFQLKRSYFIFGPKERQISTIVECDQLVEQIARILMEALNGVGVPGAILPSTAHPVFPSFAIYRINLPGSQSVAVTVRHVPLLCWLCHADAIPTKQQSSPPQLPTGTHSHAQHSASSIRDQTQCWIFSSSNSSSTTKHLRSQEHMEEPWQHWGSLTTGGKGHQLPAQNRAPSENCICGLDYCSAACSTQILLHGHYLKIFSCNFISIYDFNYVYAYTIDIVCINKTGLWGGELLLILSSWLFLQFNMKMQGWSITWRSAFLCRCLSTKLGCFHLWVFTSEIFPSSTTVCFHCIYIYGKRTLGWSQNKEVLLRPIWNSAHKHVSNVT